jgi:hypothetical protein
MGEKPQPLHQKDAYGFHLFYYFRVGEYRHPLLHHHGGVKETQRQHTSRLQEKIEATQKAILCASR